MAVIHTASSWTPPFHPLPCPAAGFQGFVRGSDAHRLILDPTVRCSMAHEQCIAPPGHSRGNHIYEQTALSLMIRLHNYTCLPRMTWCSSSTKKAAWDPEQVCVCMWASKCVCVCVCVWCGGGVLGLLGCIWPA